MLVALSSTGCATKKFVREQTTPIQQRVEAVDKKQSEALAALEGKEQKDVSRVEERAITAENKANDAARAAQQADGKATQAGETARGAASLAQTNQAKLGELATGVVSSFQNMDNLKLSSSEDVLFGFNKAVLSTDAKAKLDSVIQQTSTMGRYVLEIVGFTDKSGQRDYNLALSQRRADAVLRYLVDHNVPLRRIHMIGLGADHVAVEGETAPASHKAQRRVAVKIWVAPEPMVTASAAPAAAPPQTASQPPASQPASPEPQTKP
jgi:outer membrane protein OmpA-like peptidoglycan-associated protein